LFASNWDEVTNTREIFSIFALVIGVYANLSFCVVSSDVKRKETETKTETETEKETEKETEGKREEIEEEILIVKLYIRMRACRREFRGVVTYNIYWC
jgi:hypothetical protein